MKHRRSHRLRGNLTSKRRQAGMVVLTITLSLAVAALLMLTDARQRVRSATQSAGAILGDAVRVVNNAVGTWQATFADQIIANDSASVGVSDVRRPTVADLKAKGMLGATYNVTAPGGGQFLSAIDIEPLGCVAAACNITSRTWLSQPILAAETSSIDVRRLMAAVGAIGGDGGYSDDRTPATVQGAGGWSKPNPDAAQRAGILLAVNGYGSSAWGAFVRIRDTRDPDLRGQLTVAGDTQLKSNLTVTQNVTANKVTSNDTVTNSNHYLYAAATPNTACTQDGSVRRNSNTWAGLVVCGLGRWQPVGTTASVSDGSACGVQSQFATDINGVGYVCRNGVWRPLTVSFGSLTTNRKIDNVTDGMTFAKDSCPGGTAWALYTPKQQMVNITGSVMPPIEGVYFWMNDGGWYWAAQASAVSPAAWYSGNDVGAIGGQLVGTVTTGCAY